MLTVKISMPVVADVIEVRNDQGDLIGAVSAIAVPGLPLIAPLRPVVHFVGWAQDWDVDNPDGEYLPVCLGVDDDYHALVSEIEKRAREAQA